MGYPPTAVPRNNPLSIASLVCSLVGIIPVWGFVGSVLGVVFGFVSRSQIRRSGGMQQGSGMALAGIIIGFSLPALWIIFFVIIGSLSSQS
jgi:hypothetical protein